MARVAAAVDEPPAMNKIAKRVGTASTGQSKRSRRELTQLKWLSTLVPGAAVLLYETVRFETLEHLLRGIDPIAANIIIALALLLLTYAFASFVFRVVERVQDDAVRRGREVAALNAVVDERARLSRELHDGLAQLVAFLLVRLDTVQELVHTDRRSEAAAELEQLRRVADDLYLDVRDAIAGLRSRVAERGLVPALRDYLDEFEERHKIPVALEAPDAAVRVPDLVGMHVFRIVQEALANVRKHAQAHQAWVRVTADRLHLKVEIGDDGVGFDSTQPPRAAPRSLGLTTMRERAEVLGGTLRVDSEPGRGTRVVLEVPVEATQPTRREAGSADVAPAAG
jgi:two-component system, NarL family, sensor histidine kinase DegS